MNISLRFAAGSRYLESAPELIIKYKGRDPYLIDFARDQVPDVQRLVVDIGDAAIEDNLDIFAAAAKHHKNIAFMCLLSQNTTLLAEEHLKFFFSEPATTITKLNELLSHYPSDVTIAGELGFSLQTIAPYLKNKGISVRVIVNGEDAEAEPAHKFFIRPEALPLYEDLVDTFVLDGPLQIQDTLYSIYQEGTWAGGLEMLIPTLGAEIRNDTIMPIFDSLRMDCRKKCGYGKCNTCDNVFAIAKSLEDKGVIMKVKENK